MSAAEKGGAKAPPRGGKKHKPQVATPKSTRKPRRPKPIPTTRQDKPKAAAKRSPTPNIGVGDVSGWSGPLFQAHDIAPLAQSACVQLHADADHDKIAWQLHQAFDLSLSSIEAKNLRSPPSEWRDWLDNVHHKAEALLAALDISPGAETFKERDLIYGRAGTLKAPGMLALLRQRDAVTLPQLFSMLPQQVRDAFPLHRADDATIMHQFPAAVLNAAPWIIAYISEIGRLGAEKNAQLPHAKTRQREPFTDVLFARLALVYEEMTKEPITGLRDNTGERKESAPPILWAQAVLVHAYRVAPKVMKPPRRDFIDAILGASQSSDSRMIDLFSTKLFEKAPVFKKVLPHTQDKGEILP
jgi:hypothetical protein